MPNAKEWKIYKDNLSQHGCHIEVKHTGHEKQYTEIAYAFTEANAHLISAAPEMYEALKRMHKYTLDTNEHYVNTNLCKTVEQALAKAGGKQ